MEISNALLHRCKKSKNTGRSLPMLTLAGMGGLILLTLLCLPSEVFAQVPSNLGMSSDSVSNYASDPVTAATLAFDDALPTETILTTDHAVLLPNELDVSAQLGDLQNQLQSQNNQIASLRSQLNMPSARRGGRRPSRWFSTYESVIVQPLQENTTGVIVETDSGYAHVAFPWNLQHSPRVQFGRETGNDSLGWRVRYWQFRHSKSFVADDANGLIPAGNEGTVGYLSEDGDITVGLDFIQEGRFFSIVRTDVIDWELQRNIADPLDFYAGLRYAKVAQGYRARTDQGNAWANSSFRGLGPTVALRLQHDVVSNRLSLFANLRGSLLFGHKEFSIRDDANDLQQSIGNDAVRLSSEGADTLSGNTELQIGLRLAPSDWLALTVAFEAQNFANVGGPNPTGVFVGPDSGLAGDSPMDDSLSFAGVTVGSEVTW